MNNALKVNTDFKYKIGGQSIAEEHKIFLSGSNIEIELKPNRIYVCADTVENLTITASDDFINNLHSCTVIFETTSTIPAVSIENKFIINTNFKNFTDYYKRYVLNFLGENCIIEDFDVLVKINQKLLPTGYTALKAIGSNGSPYLQTNIRLTNNSRIVARFRVDESSSNAADLFGVTQDISSGPGFVLCFNAGEPNAVYAQYGNTSQSFNINNVNEEHKVDFNKSDLYFDDKILKFPESQFTTISNLPIFHYYPRLNQNFGLIWVSQFTVYENDVKVFDLIPCIDLQNNVIAYDAVTQTDIIPIGGILNYEL